MKLPILSTYIDNCVPINQLCDRLNSLQGNLQLVAFTLNYRLQEVEHLYQIQIRDVCIHLIQSVCICGGG